MVRPEAHFSFAVAVAFAVNYNMGTGFLTLPWAFFQAGLILSVFCLLTICVLSMLSVLCILETMSRAALCFKQDQDSLANQLEMQDLVSADSVMLMSMGRESNAHSVLSNSDEENNSNADDGNDSCRNNKNIRYYEDKDIHSSSINDSGYESSNSVLQNVFFRQHCNDDDALLIVTDRFGHII